MLQHFVHFVNLNPTQSNCAMLQQRHGQLGSPVWAVTFMNGLGSAISDRATRSIPSVSSEKNERASEPALI